MNMTGNLNIRQLVLEAEERCRPYLFETPLEYSHHLSKVSGAKVWLKLDLVQKTTSFKLRGATNKIMALSDEDLERGVVTASTGNYAFAVAEAISHRNQTATTYVARNIDPSRLQLMQAHGLEVVVHGEEAGAAEQEARRIAQAEGKTYVSPYNDPLVVGGQGTCGLEISRQLPDLDAAVFAVGGGGLIGGAGGWLKSFNPRVEIFGVSPENSPVMYESMKAGRIIEMETFPTLADTCAGGVDQDAITLGLCQKNIDGMFLLSEKEIEDAIRTIFEQHRLVAEGSAAMSVGTLLKHADRFKGKKVVLVLCGRNIDLKRFKSIISSQAPTGGVSAKTG
jgi:threonine dehydratase